MYLTDYFIFLGAILVCGIISAIASAKVSSTFNKYNQVPNQSGMTGYDTAVKLLQANNVNGISIGRVSGNLTDHYDPTKGVVNLSEITYSNNSVASVAVAAHEIGHVMQKKKGYWFYRLRTILVPIVNFGSRLAMPLVIIGFLMFLFTSTDSNAGFYVAMAGVILYGGAFLFTLVTLPVELNASKRARQMLVDNGIISSLEERHAAKVLNAAAMTYLAAMLTSLVYFLRFLVYVLSIFGRRNR